MPYFFIYLFLIIISAIFNAGVRNRGLAGDYGMAGSQINDIFSWGASKIQRRNHRIEALKKAENYLKPYENIFGSLTLSNKFCSLNINKTTDTIICISKEYDAFGKCMMLTAKNFSPIDVDEYFDMMCGVFGYNTKYNDVYNSLRAHAYISESVYSSRPVEDKLSPARNLQHPQSVVARKYTETKNTPDSGESSSNVIPFDSKRKAEKDIELNKEVRDFIDLTDGLTDVNNASEAELTALPGISVIVAKKIIQFRESHRPFRSVDDFIETMKIKPHFAKQLKNLVCANKVNMKKVKKAKAERIIDL